MPIYAEGDAGLPGKENIYQSIEKYLQECVKSANIPAMSVSIVSKNEVLFQGNYGQCRSSDTPFWLGSVSKSFTAVCIMQLAEQNKIDLTSAVSTYLPEFSDGDRITINQLLNHTSGLGEYQTLKNCRIVNPQGVHHYANVNYALLGKIIENVSGESYSAYISKNLFEPLGLSHTATTPDESVKNGLIDGYTNYWGIPIKRAHQYPSSQNAWITVPAGYISSSCEDLGKYLQMYLNGGNGVISEESINTMFYEDTVYVEGDVPFRYGYGWATVREPLPQPVLRHSGLVETGTTCIFIIPESNIAVAIETNVNDYFVTNEMVDALGWGVVLMLLGESPNEIAESTYVFSHLRIDLIMAAVLFAAILPWCLLPAYLCKSGRGRWGQRVIWIVLCHFVAPVLILLIVPVFFSVPLWVAEAFVPDVFITVAVSAALLFVGGLVKGVILYRNIRNGKQQV